MLDPRKSPAGGFRPDEARLKLGLPAAPLTAPLFAAAGARVASTDGPFRLDIRPGFLSPDQCAALIALIDSNRRPSTIADDIGEAGYRTSETCDLRGGDPLVDSVNRLLDSVAPVPGSHGETLQGQRYDVGQEFRRHTDYFEPTGSDYRQHCGLVGQRVATLMVYLDVPASGGATRFHVLDRSIRPVRGMLVAWRNVDGAGRPEPDSLHSGEPVEAGVKHIITKWYREKPYPAKTRSGQNGISA